MGGEWGLGASLTMESLPARARGLASGILQQGYSCGFLLAAVVYWVVFPHFGWRALFIVGALPALLVIYIRVHVPESAVWQRHQLTARESLGMGRFIREHWRLFIYAVFLMTAFNYMSHGTQDLYPTFLQKQRGLSVDQTAPIAIIYNLGAICGGTLLGHFSQRWGRRRTIIIAAVLGILLIPAWIFSPTPRFSSRADFFMQFMVQGPGDTGALERALAPGLAGHFSGRGLSVGEFLFRQCRDVAGETRGLFRQAKRRTRLRPHDGLRNAGGFSRPNSSRCGRARSARNRVLTEAGEERSATSGTRKNGRLAAIHPGSVTVVDDRFGDFVRQLFPIRGVGGVSGFGAVAKVAAFHEDRWVMGVAEDPEVGRMHAAIYGSRKRGQILLNCGRQREGVGRMVISFDAFHSAPARVVEVNANEDGVPLFVADRDPVAEWNEKCWRE